MHSHIQLLNLACSVCYLFIGETVCDVQKELQGVQGERAVRGILHRSTEGDLTSGQVRLPDQSGP